MDCGPFTVDPDPSVARTPPGALYGDAGLYRAMLDRAFAPSWQPLLDLGEVAAGELVPTTLLPGSLDEPLLLVADGDERVLSNVCTHRGATLVKTRRRGPRVVCPYHGRCFGRDGVVQAAPGFAGREGELPGLPAVPLERLGPLRFVRIADGVSLGPTGVRALLETRSPGLPWDRLAACSGAAVDYDVPVHWALYVENYLEGLHIPFVHPSLDRAVGRDTYVVEAVDGGVLQTAQPRRGGVTLPGGAAALYLWTFPNVMLNVYPWGLSLNVVMPRGVGACRVAFRTFVWDPTLQEQGAGAGLDAVEREDEAVVARVAQGVRARLYGRGHYAVPAEVGVHHFHRLLTAALWG